MKNIKYICFYSTPVLERENRDSSLAATNKIDYICKALNDNGINVELISPSWTNNKSGLYPGKRIQLNSNSTLTVFSTFGGKTIPVRIMKYLWSLLQLFLYLLFHVRKNEKILVYHSVILSLPLRIAKLIKGFNLILEVEEIYSEVWNTKTLKVLHKSEKKLIESADHYIIVSNLLKENLNINNAIVLYGSYYPVKNKRTYHSSEYYVHLVYAGSIDETRGGAFNAVKAMRYLPNNYCLHIIGFGSDKCIMELTGLIEEENKLSQKKTIVYDGVFYGQDYSDFLHKCDIALNPQYEGNYMTTAFPSKIISYLSHNLRVVSTNIPSISKSEVSGFIHFSKSDSPIDFASAIKSVDMSEAYDSLRKIEELDKKFVKELKEVLS